MNRISLTAVCACCVILSTPAIAGPGHGHKSDKTHAQAGDAKPINALCPIGEEAVEDDGGRSVYKGNTIGFCCPGCISRFDKWDEAKKDEFVAMSMMGTPPTKNDDHAKMSGHNAGGDVIPYILNTCPVSGGKLGSMGEPIVKEYNGREVKFCCKMCVPQFEKNLKASFAKVDQKIIESQLAFYPTTDCIVSGDTLGDEEMGEPINFVHNNRLVRFCCKMCKSDFKADPQAFIAKLDKIVIAQQGEDYPLSTCPISGKDLGEKGEAINVVFGGRLVKLCCEKCAAKFKANPMPTMEKIEAAWMAKHEG